MDFTDLDSRLVEATTLLEDPSVLEGYAPRFLLVLDRVGLTKLAYPRLLEALELLEGRGWTTVSVLHDRNMEGRMYALVRRGD